MLLDHLDNVTDPRRAQGKRYPLKYLLLFAIFAILSGAQSYRDVCRFMDKKRLVLNNFFDLCWKAAPSKSQLRAIFCEIQTASLETSFRDYSSALNAEQEEAIQHRVGLDGKALRGSGDAKTETGMLHMLSAFCATTQLILGHLDIAEKSNEIPAAQQLIAELDLPAGSLYTADAIHCQKKRLKRRNRRNVA
jgi:hypothetical protein